MAALDLTELELSTALQACRAMAYQEEERAKQMGNPGMREMFEQASRRYAELARKFERALKQAAPAARPAGTRPRAR